MKNLFFFPKKQIYVKNMKLQISMGNVWNLIVDQGQVKHLKNLEFLVVEGTSKGQGLYMILYTLNSM